MSIPTKVLVLSPTGRTGCSVVDGLLNSSQNFEITALTRKSSLGNPKLKTFEGRGVKIISTDLHGPKKDLVEALTGIDVVISAIYWLNMKDQLPLIEAAKEAGVKRFVPCFFGTAAPQGVMMLHDEKHDILAAVQRAHLPWTVIDVGWWSNQVVPALPSRRTEKFVMPILDILPGDGSVPVAFTDFHDIGNYTATIITDPRTLNRKVLAYTDVLTLKQVGEIMEELSGEKPIQKFLPEEQIKQGIAAAKADFEVEEKRGNAKLQLVFHQYMESWGLRGDNTPEAAEIFGYLDFKKLYPDHKGKTIRQLFQGILDGSEEPIPSFELK